MKYFFITSLGRSGTKFLSNLLNQLDHVICLHEPFNEDYINLKLSYFNCDSLVLKSQLEKRFLNVDNQLKSNKYCKFYGEVNSLLRYNTKWLEDNLGAKIVHITRNPKKVVPSIYSRTIFKKTNRNLEIIPLNSDKFSKDWHNMSRFEKICWYWTHTNNYLFENVDVFFRFEDLISDYEKFVELLNYLELPVIDESLWKKEIIKPKNTSKKSVFKKSMRLALQFKNPKVKLLGNYEKWDNDMKKKFELICYNTMKKFDYEI